MVIIRISDEEYNHQLMITELDYCMTIKTHSTFRIAGYRNHINPAWRQKLLSMGMIPGTLIEIIRVAPMGDPVQIRTRRISLAVRRKDLSAILLEEISA